MILVLTLLAPTLHDGAAARASTFTVSTVHIFLTAKTRSGILTVRNTSESLLRFQASVFAWDQSTHGEMRLAATRDIVLFPTLFSLTPGEERNLRVGAAVQPAANETTYRLFIEELPSQEGGSGMPGQVAIRTRLGIPIFLRPAKEVTSGRVDQVVVREGHLGFSVRNTGNVHFLARSIRVTGQGSTGETIFERNVEGWYVLAGGTRFHDLELPPDKCPLLKKVAIEVQTPQATLSERVDLPAVGCRP